MARRLPPLNALRAFEAAARHLSFTKAAAELNVTPAAISHQIKSLEEITGAPLFKRLTRALSLSARGQRVLPLLSDGFDLLAEAATQLSDTRQGDVFTISTSPSFAAKWLVPRLDEFQQLTPRIKVRIDASLGLVDFNSDDVDVAIRYGGGKYSGCDTVRLFDEEIFPVCSPLLMNGAHPLNNPEDLVHHTLLHSSYAETNTVFPQWRMWLKAAGVEGVDWHAGPEFSLENVTVQAALAGQGVALINTSLVADDLASGALVRPFELSIKMDFAYYLVIPTQTRDHPTISIFRKWLLGIACS